MEDSNLKMIKLVVTFIFVANTLAQDPWLRSNSLSPTGRIVGGVATSIDEVPYQVSLLVYGSHICGGSIISTNWVLTAAHCMVYSIGWYAMRTGSTLSNRGGTVSLVAAIKIHESYGTNSFGIPLNDVALVRPGSPFVLESVRAVIPLYSAGEETVVGSDAVVTGWGTLAEGGSSPTVLQTVTVPIVSKSDCSAAYAALGGLPDHQICAAVLEGGKDACQGDSGGPLAIDGRLAGIVSWGNGCARAGFPGVYAEVAAYHSWIFDNAEI